MSAPVSDGLRLFIGGIPGPLNSIQNPFTNNGFRAHSLLQGETFAMRWVNNLTSAYTCEATALRRPLTGDVPVTWDTWSGRNVNASETATFVTSESTITGTYIFKVSCSNGPDTQADTVSLEVKSSDGTEL